jgi:hypothetical protein
MCIASEKFEIISKFTAKVSSNFPTEKPPNFCMELSTVLHTKFEIIMILMYFILQKS